MASSISAGSLVEKNQKNCLDRFFFEPLNKIVNWTAKNTCECISNQLSSRLEGTDAVPAHGTFRKIVNFIVGLVVSLALLPVSLLVSAGKGIKNLCCAKTEEKKESPTDPQSVEDYKPFRKNH